MKRKAHFQRTLASQSSYEKFGRKSKRELFLDEMNAVVPWGALLSLVEPYYAKVGMVLRCKRERIPMGAWMTALETRAPRNVLIVAAANKLARIAWAVLSSGQDYRAVQQPVAA